jgi:hypothetical protein
MIFTHYSDPAHGWLRVDVQTAESVGLKPDDFSTFSYAYAHWLYLEEDMDAATFVRAYRAKYGADPQIKCSNTNRPSNIRNYPRIR